VGENERKIGKKESSSKLPKKSYSEIAVERRKFLGHPSGNSPSVVDHRQRRNEKKGR